MAHVGLNVHFPEHVLFETGQLDMTEAPSRLESTLESSIPKSYANRHFVRHFRPRSNSCQYKYTSINIAASLVQYPVLIFNKVAFLSFFSFVHRFTNILHLNL